MPDTFKDETLYETDYIRVKRRDGWYDMTSAQDSNEVVGVLLADGEGRYLVRHENCPPYYHNINQFNMVALTGMKEIGESPLEAAKREIEEESGLCEGDYVIHDCGWVFTNKQCDMKIHLFIGTVKDKYAIKADKLHGVGDGTKGEEGSFAYWASKEEIFKKSVCGVLYQLLAVSN
jgi:8-oxo-dGTP pyrophosphatase MutT (NUDIX family)